MAKKPFLTCEAAALADTLDALDAPASTARTLIESTYVQLRDDIVEGILRPGERLRIEHIKTRYGVGAGTIREAITRLASDHLVQAEGQRGFRVSGLSMEDLRDLTALRIHIELNALRSSIRRSDEAWRERVRQAFEQLTQEEQPVRPEGRKRWEMLNTRFHEALVSGCDSPRTLRILGQLAREGERYRRFTIKMSGPQNRDVHVEHQLIFDLAMNGQEARAALALEAHICTTTDMLERALRSGVDIFQTV
ncbi:MAG: GntR family transcriptional regulator [Comamonas sp.]|nr:GntR family transcriptional regulator [Comamonas sp.]